MQNGTNKLNKYGSCPCCGENWDGGSIAEYLIQRKKDGIMYWADKSDKVIRSIVKDDYGSENARFSKLEIADGVAKCQACKQTFPGAVIEEETEFVFAGNDDSIDPNLPFASKSAY